MLLLRLKFYNGIVVLDRDPKGPRTPLSWGKYGREQARPTQRLCSISPLLSVIVRYGCEGGFFPSKGVMAELTA